MIFLYNSAKTTRLATQSKDGTQYKVLHNVPLVTDFNYCGSENKCHGHKLNIWLLELYGLTV